MSGTAILRVDGPVAAFTILNNESISRPITEQSKSLDARIFVENGARFAKLSLGPTIIQIPVFFNPGKTGGEGLVGTAGIIIDPFHLISFAGGLDFVALPA
jgi:hypothetical protein